MTLGYRLRRVLAGAGAGAGAVLLVLGAAALVFVLMGAVLWVLE